MACLSGIPQLAEGGITNGATLAMIGEGKEQEAVLPLSKLASLMGGFGINGMQSARGGNMSAMAGGSGIEVGQIRLDGNVIVAAIKRTFKYNGSSGGAVNFG